jgi:hypothetical protein
MTTREDRDKAKSAMTEKTIWLFAGCLIATVGFHMLVIKF